MTAHLYLPAIEPQPDLPATLSKTVLTGLLREQLGYQGLILTDALDMEAIKKDRTAAEAAVEAFEAGADMLLIARHHQRRPSAHGRRPAGAPRGGQVGPRVGGAPRRIGAQDSGSQSQTRHCAWRSAGASAAYRRCSTAPSTVRWRWKWRAKP